MRRLPLMSLVCVELGACTGNESWVDAGSVDVRASHYEQRLTWPEREIWLFVLDDAPTPEARTLRERIAAAVGLPDGGPFAPSESVCPGDTADPIHPDPIDLRVAVVRPSHSVEQWTTPHEIPGLTWQGERDDPKAYASWLASLRAELVRDSTSDDWVTYSPIQAIYSGLSLLSGARSPSTPTEASAIESLGISRPMLVRVFAATTRDDESPGTVSDYPILDFEQLDARPPFFYELRTLLVPASGTSESLATTLPRWFEFTDSLEPNVVHFSTGTPSELFASTGLEGKLTTPCWGAPLVRDSDGFTQCRIHVVSDELSSCDAARGWLDPLVAGATRDARGPKFETDLDGTKRRVCEIRQLSGDSLVQCLTRLDASPAESGWCYPLPSQECRQRCPVTQVPVAFRLVGESLRVDAKDLRLRYDCLLDPGE